jgi:hypothetical protein
MTQTEHEVPTQTQLIQGSACAEKKLMGDGYHEFTVRTLHHSEPLCSFGCS